MHYILLDCFKITVSIFGITHEKMFKGEIESIKSSLFDSKLRLLRP